MHNELQTSLVFFSVWFLVSVQNRNDVKLPIIYVLSMISTKNSNQTTRRYHFTPITMAIIFKKRTTARVDKNAEKLEPFYAAGGTIKWFSHEGKQFVVPQKLNTKWSYDSAILLLGILKTIKNRAWNTYLYTIINSSIIHNRKNPTVHQHMKG